MDDQHVYREWTLKVRDTASAHWLHTALCLSYQMQEKSAYFNFSLSCWVKLTRIDSSFIEMFNRRASH